MICVSEHLRRLKKVTLCKTPTKSKGYKDYYVIVVFDIAITIVRSSDINWLLLKNTNVPQHNYVDALLHWNHIFVVSAEGFNVLLEP